MNILLTGANGYIGKRLLQVLLQQGHDVICSVRDRQRFSVTHPRIVEVVEMDFSAPTPNDMLLRHSVDVVFYLLHSMTASKNDFGTRELEVARHFIEFTDRIRPKQIIYLSGIINEKELSPHLASRKKVEHILRSGHTQVTTLRAAIIVGSGSSSFEIIRDLVEKLPVMIAPRWLNTPTQPIAIRDVISCLTGAMLRGECFGKSVDVGGPEILTYKSMLLQYAKIRGLKRWIITMPFLTPKLSSYWLYFITSINFSLARHLVESMKVPVVCRNNRAQELIGRAPLTYKEAVTEAFQVIEQNLVISSWKDSFVSSRHDPNITRYMEVPEYGCLKDVRRVKLTRDPAGVMDNLWQIGGNRGWYYASFLWRIRGTLDKLFGGVGMRRGRTNETEINAGDALDFWRVIVADKKQGRLLLYAEMKLPGEAWLEFRLTKNGQPVLVQTATFRPKGLAGRFYWYLLFPIHHFIFNGMIRNIVNYKNTDAGISNDR